MPALQSVITEPAMERLGLRKHEGPETLATVLSVPDTLAKSTNIQSRWGQKENGQVLRHLHKCELTGPFPGPRQALSAYSG